MVNVENPQWDAVFKALSDSKRRQILAHVAQSNPTVSELAAPFKISGPAISKHLKVLESSGLVTRMRDGKSHRFRINPKPLQNAEAIIQQLTAFWTQRLDHLENYLSQTSENK